MSSRLIGLDILKIAAALGVICIHVSATIMNNVPVLTGNWVVAFLFDSSVRWCVPIFLMVGGGLILGHESSPESLSDLLSLYRRRILPLLVTFFVWSAVYCVFDLLAAGWNGWSHLLARLITGKYHLWYIQMLIGIYVLLPALALLRSNRFISIYFLLAMLSLSTICAIAPLVPLGDGVREFINGMSINFGYVGYFLLGSILFETPLKFSGRAHLITFLLLLIINSALAIIICFGEHSLNATLFDYFSPFVALQSTVLYSAFARAQKIRIKENTHETFEKRSKLFVVFSNNGLGVYILHLMIVESVVPRLSGAPAIVMIPIWTLLIFLVCQGLTSLIKKVPLIGGTL